MTSKKKVVVTDIDGTVIDNKSYQNMATVAVKDGPKGKGVKIGDRFTVEEFAKLDWRYEDVTMWDFSEWDDATKNVENILRSDLIDANVHLIEEFREKGYEVRFLTARGGGADKEIEDDIGQALSYRLGYEVKGYAVGDYRTYGSNKEVKMPVKKQNVLAALTQEFDEVVFIDDEDVNLELARAIAGVTAIKALTS